MLGADTGHADDPVRSTSVGLAACLVRSILLTSFAIELVATTLSCAMLGAHAGVCDSGHLQKRCTQCYSFTPNPSLCVCFIPTPALRRCCHFIICLAVLQQGLRRGCRACEQVVRSGKVHRVHRPERGPLAGQTQETLGPRWRGNRAP